MFLTYWLLLSLINQVSLTRKPILCGDKKCPKFIGGKYTSIQEFPHTVALFKYENMKNISYICAGSVIRSRIILTATRCFFKTNISSNEIDSNKTNPADEAPIEILDFSNFKKFTNTTYFIIAGHEDLLKATTVRDVRKILLHECYDHEFVYNDIALLLLSDRLPFNRFIKPVTIRRNFPAGVQMVKVTGWGVISTNGQSTIKLKYTEMKLKIQRKCCKMLRSNGKRMHKGLMCAGHFQPISTTNNRYYGVSGGPVIVAGNRQIGVVSFTQNGIEFFANVSYYHDWIKTNADKLLKEDVFNNR